MKNKKKALLTIREIAIFGMLGGLMYASKILMNAFPNVHFIGVSIMAITLVYRWKALFPIIRTTVMMWYLKKEGILKRQTLFYAAPLKFTGYFRILLTTACVTELV